MQEFLDMKTKDLFKFSNCLCDSKKIKFLHCKRCQKKYETLRDLFKESHDEIKKFTNKKGRTCILNDTWVKCEEKAIGSHTISKGNHLSYLAGDLDTSVYTFDNDNSYLLLKNEYATFKGASYMEIASIFYGLCHPHDNIYFPIDKKFDYTNMEHMLLMAHRQTLYEYHQKEEILKCFIKIKSILDSLKIFKLGENYRKVYSQIYQYIINNIFFIKGTISNLKKNILNFKEEFEISLKETGEAIFKKNMNSKYIYCSIKFEKKMEFSFSTCFALKYSFNEELIYPRINDLKYNLQTPYIGLINDDKHSYFVCICINNPENLKFIKTLSSEIQINANTLLKCALMNENSYFSGNFKRFCETEKIPKSFYDGYSEGEYVFHFETIDKLLGFLYLEDSKSLIGSNEIFFIDEDLMRIKSINCINHLNILKKNSILDIIHNF